ncbi:MAG: hypothetical protein FJ161_03345 [Gammaproteobacteria bacterium]|nr:hypothetical protein [Gammaproteobacteria bacterium]
MDNNSSNNAATFEAWVAQNEQGEIEQGLEELAETLQSLHAQEPSDDIETLLASAHTSAQDLKQLFEKHRTNKVLDASGEFSKDYNKLLNSLKRIDVPQSIFEPESVHAVAQSLFADLEQFNPTDSNSQNELAELKSRMESFSYYYREWLNTVYPKDENNSQYCDRLDKMFSLWYDENFKKVQKNNNIDVPPLYTYSYDQENRSVMHLLRWLLSKITCYLTSSRIDTARAELEQKLSKINDTKVNLNPIQGLLYSHALSYANECAKEKDQEKRTMNANNLFFGLCLSILPKNISNELIQKADSTIKAEEGESLLDRLINKTAQTASKWLKSLFNNAKSIIAGSPVIAPLSSNASGPEKSNASKEFRS